MPKIFNPTSNGANLGQALADLGRQMFGDTAGAALKKEQTYAAQRENTETDNLMQRVAQQGGAHDMDPVAQGMLIGSGFDPSKYIDLALASAATKFGATDKRTQDWQVGAGQFYDNTAGAFGAKLAETIRNNNMQSSDRRYGVDRDMGQRMFEFSNVGADQAIDNAEIQRNNDLQSSDRRYGVDQGQATERYKFDNDPVAVMGPTGPTYSRKADIVGNMFKPILSETDQKGTLLGQNWDNLPDLNPEQRQVLGANPSEGSRTPRNYRGPDNRNYITYDGATDVGGNPLPQGGYLASVEGSASDAGLTNSTTTDTQKSVIANRRLNYLLDMAEGLTADPNLFGIQGKARTLGQELVAGVSGLGQLFGDKSTGGVALDVARKEAAGLGLQGLLPELYDPNLPAVQTIWGLLTYQVASALAGQRGQGASDKDIVAARQIVGEPQSLFSSAEMARSKLQQVRNIVAGYDAIDREALGDAAPVAPAVPLGGTSGDVPWEVMR